MRGRSRAGITAALRRIPGAPDGHGGRRYRVSPDRQDAAALQEESPVDDDPLKGVLVTDVVRTARPRDLSRMGHDCDMQSTIEAPQVAYVYPAPYWSSNEDGWVKSLLLFFDQVAILLPAYMYGRHLAADPTLAEPLEARGLLRVLEPGTWVDEDMANQLATAVVALLTSGAFDDLDRERGPFQELSQSRMGYGADIGLATWLVDELTARGLARPSEDGVSIPLHATVRTTILVLLSQLARGAGPKNHMSIHPATSHPQAVSDLAKTLGRDHAPSAAGVVGLDLQAVSFDMDPVPLDELLAFRTEHHGVHKSYMRNLHGFMAELSLVTDGHEREQLLLERSQEIADTAHDLQRVSRRAFGKKLTSWSLGIAGAAWSASTGDPIGLALTACGLVVPELIRGTSNANVEAYSYLFAAQHAAW